MTTMPMPWATSIRAASSISDPIAQQLAPGGDAGNVHSVFRAALNISWQDRLLTIAPASAGGLPNGIVAELGPDFRSLALHEGMRFHADAHELRVDAAALVINLDGAVRWSPRIGPPLGGSRVAAERWRQRSQRARVESARVIARTSGARGGLGPLLLAAPVDADLDTADRAGPILARLDTAIRDNDRSGATAAARSLIGLGPGLTPSGDDALVGIEAALWGLGAPVAAFLAGAVDDVEQRTTAVAATLLRHAAAGEFAERLHDLVGVLIGSDDAAIPAAIERAVGWGATSGADCLVGVLLGLDAASGRRWRVD